MWWVSIQTSWQHLFSVALKWKEERKSPRRHPSYSVVISSNSVDSWSVCSFCLWYIAYSLYCRWSITITMLVELQMQSNTGAAKAVPQAWGQNLVLFREQVNSNNRQQEGRSLEKNNRISLRVNCHLSVLFHCFTIQLVGGSACWENWKKQV